MLWHSSARSNDTPEFYLVSIKLRKIKKINSYHIFWLEHLAFYSLQGCLFQQSSVFKQGLKKSQQITRSNLFKYFLQLEEVEILINSRVKFEMRESRGKGIPRGFFYCVKICMKDSKFVRWFHIIMRTFQTWKFKNKFKYFCSYTFYD